MAWPTSHCSSPSTFPCSPVPLFAWAAVSPYAARLGSTGTAGRLRLRAGAVWKGHPTTIDVLAARRIPAFLGPDPGKTRRFAGHCERHDIFGDPAYEAWVPSTAEHPGEAWLIVKRHKDVGMFRFSGGPVGASGSQAEAGSVALWNFQRDVLAEVGLRGYRFIRDFDPRPDPA